MYGTNRDSLRQHYYDVWDKLQTKAVLTPFEQQLADVILEHPEFHRYLQPLTRQMATSLQLTQDDTNPFMHMGLHLAIRDQVQLDKPQGIRALFQQLLQRYQDRVAAEHILLPIMAEVLHEALQRGHMPDEQRYLEKIRNSV